MTRSTASWLASPNFAWLRLCWSNICVDRPQISNIKLTLNMNQKQVNQEKKHQTTFKKKNIIFQALFPFKKKHQNKQPRPDEDPVLRCPSDLKRSTNESNTWSFVNVPYLWPCCAGIFPEIKALYI
jgi:hypothetical protein